MMKKSVVLLLGSLVLVFAFGCNTMQGLGKDIKSAGDSLEKAADK